MRIEKLGQRLMDARKLADDLSARELDRLAGVAEGYASMIEAGTRTNVAVRVAVGYARVLGLSIDYLVTGAGSPPSARAVKRSVAAAREAAEVAA